jgi:hypothetical protein
MQSNINYLYLKENKILKGLSKEETYKVLNNGKFTRRKKSEGISISEGSIPNLYFLIERIPRGSAPGL